MDETVQQLSFNVGGTPPEKALVRFSGGVFLARELTKGEEIHLQVVDADGRTVADGYGRVVAVAFKDTLDKETGDVVSSERVHSVKVS
jgi:hypothetical protein